MNPVGSYYRLEGELREAQQKLGLDACITFGILFVDARQSEAKEHIINYMNSFDRKSGKYFDFFIPGYVEYGKGEPAFKLKRTTQEFFFDDDLFDEFCEWSERKLGIEYTYNPMLILISMNFSRLTLSDSLHNFIQRFHTAGQYCFVDLELVVVEGVAFSGDSSQEYGEETFCFAEITVSIISGEE